MERLQFQPLPTHHITSQRAELHFGGW